MFGKTRRWDAVFSRRELFAPSFRAVKCPKSLMPTAVPSSTALTGSGSLSAGNWAHGLVLTHRALFTGSWRGFSQLAHSCRKADAVQISEEMKVSILWKTCHSQTETCKSFRDPVSTESGTEQKTYLALSGSEFDSNSCFEFIQGSFSHDTALLSNEQQKCSGISFQVKFTLHWHTQHIMEHSPKVNQLP